MVLKVSRQKHAVIYVTGLNDQNITLQRAAVSTWKIFAVEPILLQTNWADGKPFSEKLDRLLAQIDDFEKRGYKISLIGVSAGATVVLTAFALRKKSVSGVACICGKIGRPEAVGASYFIQNPAFRSAIFGLRQYLDMLKAGDRQRVLSIRPLFDEIVATKDTKLQGAKKAILPTLFHVPSIALGISIFSFVPILFLKRIIKKSRIEA